MDSREVPKVQCDAQGAVLEDPRFWKRNNENENERKSGIF